MTHELTDKDIAALWYGAWEPGHDVAPGYAVAPVYAVTFARAVEAKVLAHLAQRGTSDYLKPGDPGYEDSAEAWADFVNGAASPQAVQPMPDGGKEGGNE